MKIYALYYKDTFVVAFPNREDCIDYGKKYYEGREWECNIIEKYIHHSHLNFCPAARLTDEASLDKTIAYLESFINE